MMKSVLKSCKPIKGNKVFDINYGASSFCPRLRLLVLDICFEIRYDRYIS